MSRFNNHQPKSDPETKTVRNFPILILLLVLTFLVYLNCLGNDFVSDDIPSIVNNPNIGHFSYVLSNYLSITRPFVYWLAFSLSGLQPLFYRLFNLLFHLGNVVLIYKIASKLINKRVGIVAAVLTAIHPILTEGVIWISGGAYSQACFFTLLTLYFYLISENARRYYLFSIMTYFLAVTSQLTSLALLPFLFFYTIFFKKRTLLSLTPFFLLGVFIIGLSLSGIASRSQDLVSTNYQQKGVDNPLLVIPVAIVNYLILIIWPLNLTIYHSELSYNLVQYIATLAVFLFIIVFYLLALKRNKQVFLWLTLAFASLLPTLLPAIFRLTWIVAERYVYMGAIGIFVVLAYYLDKLADIEFYRKYVYIGVFIIVILLSIRTIVRNNDWKNQDNLWMATSFTSPSSPTNHNNLGDLYGRHGDTASAIREFQTAIALKPNYGDAYHNLGNAYRDSGQYSQAIQSYKQAIQINPYLWQSYQNIAAIYFNQKDYQQAIDYLNQGVKLNPKVPSLYLALGTVYTALNDPIKAREQFTKALQLDPGNIYAQKALGQIGK